jgi:hypothetical protein
VVELGGLDFGGELPAALKGRVWLQDFFRARFLKKKILHTWSIK